MLLRDDETKGISKPSKREILSREVDRYFLDEIFGYSEQGKDDAWLLKQVWILNDGSGCILTKKLLDQYKERLFSSGQLDYDRYYMDKILYHYRPGNDSLAHGYVLNLSVELYKEYKKRLVVEGSLPNHEVEFGTNVGDRYFMYQVLYLYRMEKDDEWIRKYLQRSVERYAKCKEILSDERELRLMNFKSFKNFGYLSYMEFQNLEYFVEKIMLFRREGKDDQFIQKHLQLSSQAFEKFEKLLKEEP